jgi:diaminopimelate decarboxylase
MSPEPFRIGLLGHGTVGASFAELLAQRAEAIVPVTGMQPEIADRFGHGTHCHLVGKHCESGDVLITQADLRDPQPGDVVVTPATGGYGHSMANNYNGQPRPPVVFCSGGHSRVVVRRETYEELHGRDV